VQPQLHDLSAARPFSYVELQRLSDQELMSALQTGAHDALVVLFDRYHRQVLSVALEILHDRAEAEDVMQTVFLDVFRLAPKFDASKSTVKTSLLLYACRRALSRKAALRMA
jgi:RNA polymerase sigma-70 factor, ECF subfamily